MSSCRGCPRVRRYSASAFWRHDNILAGVDGSRAGGILDLSDDEAFAYLQAHTADRWVALCATAKYVPLRAGDGVYIAAPSLTMFSH